MDEHSDAAYELFQRIRNSEGERICWKMKGLTASYHVFAGNHAHLSQAIRHGQSEEQARNFSTDQDRRIEQLQMEHLRLLHNFLSGASTLIDHTRNLMDELYAGQPFRGEYQAKLDEAFKKSNIAGFVKGLRNWMSHRGIVPVMMQATVDAALETVTLSIVLDIAELKLWDKWDLRAKQYLADARPPLRLSDVVQGYHDLVEQFYRWLVGRMQQIHARAFEEWNGLREQYRALRPGA